MNRTGKKLAARLQTTWLDASGTKPISKRGGKRRGAGRPPKGKRAGSSHTKRPRLRANTPVHVTLRVVSTIGSLRKRLMYQALRWATLAMCMNHEDCRIVHISVQRDHIHLLVEADSEQALARGMQGFQGSAAKRLNAALKWRTPRKGQVFTDRYDATYITSPRQARSALAYVLNNWRKHREDGPLARAQRGGKYASVKFEHDWFSSGWMFAGWREREGLEFIPETPDGFEPLAVWFPRSWLLTTGWRKHGLISFWEIPSARRTPQRSARRTSSRSRSPSQ